MVWAVSLSTMKLIPHSLIAECFTILYSKVLIALKKLVSNPLGYKVPYPKK